MTLGQICRIYFESIMYRFVYDLFIWHTSITNYNRVA